MEVSSRRVFPRVLMSWWVHVEDFCLEEHALFLSASLRSLARLSPPFTGSSLRPVSPRNIVRDSCRS